MKIIMTNACKRFNYEWVFKNLNFTFESGNTYALTGKNGSGKTTLLRILSGYSALSDGQIQFLLQEKKIPEAILYKHIAVCSPASAIIDEMTLFEQLEFQQQFKPFINQLSVKEIIHLMHFEKHQHKVISEYSTGMKQRVKLVLAILADTELLLLDEPSSNIDQEGIAWMHELIRTYSLNRLVVIASNEETDLVHCSKRLSIDDYKINL
jgi:ABC-type multidrug transport system ATPase subunit